MVESSALKAGLYIVATPIGNLGDLSTRAVEILGSVDLIAAEDTRHTRKLLQHVGLATKMVALHDHNERNVTAALIQKIADGMSIALVSDAGTPLMSDPGFFLVREAKAAEISVIPVPGVNAAICALSAAGLPTDRFIFEGFPPPKQAGRIQLYDSLEKESRTVIFYESSHRILASLEDMANCFGAERVAVVARELTKTFETIKKGSFQQLLEWMRHDKNQQRGEFVVLVQGKPAEDKRQISEDADRLLTLLLAELSLKQSASLVSKITGCSKRVLYAHGLKLKAP